MVPPIENSVDTSVNEGVAWYAGAIVVQLPIELADLELRDYRRDCAPQCLPQFRQDESDLIAVAHSVSGIVLPLLATRLPLRAWYRSRPLSQSRD